MLNGVDIEIDINHRIPAETTQPEENFETNDTSVKMAITEVNSNKNNNVDISPQDGESHTNRIPHALNDDASNDDTVKETSKDKKKY